MHLSCSNFRHNLISRFYFDRFDWLDAEHDFLFVNFIIEMNLPHRWRIGERPRSLCVCRSWFKSRESQTIKNGICFFSVKHAALTSKSTDRLSSNQEYESQCLPADCWFSGLISYKDQIERVGLVQSRHDHFIECNLFSQCYCLTRWR